MRKPGGLSLRVRLLVITLAALLLGIAAIDLVTVTALDSFLVSRVDNQLAQDIPLATRALLLRGVGVSNYSTNLMSLPPGTFGIFVFDNGSTITSELSAPSSNSGPPPQVTKGPPGLQKIDIPIDHPITLESAKGDYTYRVLAVPDPSLLGSMVLAIPLTQINDTISRLELAELLVSGGVILGLGVAAAVSIRLGLAPLERIRQKARMITAGDQNARVDESGPAEVSTLAQSLNTMLERLQKALEDSKLSQSRLRQFIADVSHELRTPLTSIKGYAELYLGGVLESEADLSLAMERISSESSRMAALIEDLLLLARMDQNRPLELAPVNLSEIVERAILDAKAVEPDRVIDTQITSDAMVLGDENRLTQIIVNLLSNLRTHTPPQSRAKVCLEILERSASLPAGAKPATTVTDMFGDIDPTIKMLQYSKMVRLSVTDSGPGLAPEQLERVFERFYRSDESRSRAKGGAGLGLALVAAIAKSHGGTAWVVSEGPGQGATFGVDLPLLEMDTDTGDQIDGQTATRSRIPFHRRDKGIHESDYADNTGKPK
jgi:two-component system OmpR family sensor kinase